MSQKRLVVIGGGAAGFFCAINAARLNPALKVVLLEKTGKLLSKVKVSGGGRCNVTHACFDIAQAIQRYPRGTNFLKKAFHHFFTSDTIEWFESRKVPLKTEADGRMFPVSNNSQTIIDCLLKEAEQYGVEILMHTVAQAVCREDKLFKLQLNGERVLYADYVCIAVGGFSKPGQYAWLQSMGHHIEDPVPSLFTFNVPGNPITQLMGVSVDKAIVKIAGTKFQEEGPLLITHWGMSGPAVLKLSAWAARALAVCNWHFNITVNWLPSYHEQKLRLELQHLRSRLASAFLHGKNSFGLPQRLWLYLLAQCEIPETLRWADLPAAKQNLLSKILCAQEFAVQGKTTFKEEFVTAGGIQTTEIDAASMQSRLVKGLYFAGEVMNVDGITGGYNFQHAWTSGFIAAHSIAVSAANL